MNLEEKQRLNADPSDVMQDLLDDLPHNVAAFIDESQKKIAELTTELDTANERTIVAHSEATTLEAELKVLRAEVNVLKAELKVLKSHKDDPGFGQ